MTGHYEQRDGNSALQCYLPTLRKRTSPDMGTLVCGVLFQFYFVVYLMMPFLLFSWWSAFSGAACAGNCTHSHSCQTTADQTRLLSCCCNKERGCTEMLLFELLCSECSGGFFIFLTGSATSIFTFLPEWEDDWCEGGQRWNKGW